MYELSLLRLTQCRLLGVSFENNNKVKKINCRYWFYDVNVQICAL